MHLALATIDQMGVERKKKYATDGGGVIGEG
jgi:hypothetical protein